jgi:hypothetical protein
VSLQVVSSGTEKLFVRAVQILTENFSHGEHVYAVLFEHSAHRIITADLTSIAWVLKIMLVNVLPELFDCLWS